MAFRTWKCSQTAGWLSLAKGDLIRGRFETDMRGKLTRMVDVRITKLVDLGGRPLQSNEESDAEGWRCFRTATLACLEARYKSGTPKSLDSKRIERFWRF
jgi:hypothetical protein